MKKMTAIACILTSIVITPSMAMADSSAPISTPTSFYNGAYLGGGYVGRLGDLNTKSSSTTTVSGTSTSANHSANRTTGFNGGVLYLGYGHTFENNFYLGGELDGLGFIPGSDTKDVAGLERTTPYGGFTVSVLPGFVITPRTLLFARLGMGGMDYRDSTTKSSSNVTLNNLATTSTSSTTHHSKMLAEYEAGLGASYMFTQHFNVRGEYDYVMSPRTDLAKNQSTATMGQVTSVTTSTESSRPGFSQLMVTVGYNF